MAENPEVTPVSEWSVPNQDKIEQVIDARLGRNDDSAPAESEPAVNEPEEPDTTTVSNDEKQGQAEEPKS